MIPSKAVLRLLLISSLTLLIWLAPAQAAPTVDLTTVGSSGYANGAYFEWVDASSTGTGVIDSFARMGTNQSVERGYNTDGTVEFDTKDDIHTHSVLLSEVAIVDIGGTLYRQFMLDIIESGGSKSTLSLDTIEIYLADVKDLSGYPNLGTKIFDLDSGGDVWILLDASLNSGGGSGDMFAYIPNSLFTGGDYVYLYSKFGESEGSAYPNDGGFEEWARLLGIEPPPPPPIPAPGALLLALAGSNLVIWLRGRKLM